MKKALIIVLLVLNVYYSGYGPYNEFYGFKLGEIYTPEEISNLIWGKGFKGKVLEEEEYQGRFVYMSGKFKISHDIYDVICFKQNLEGRVIAILFEKEFTYEEALKDLMENPDGSGTGSSAVYARMRKMAKERFERVNNAFNYLSFPLIKKNGNVAEYRTTNNDVNILIEHKSTATEDKIFLMYKLNKK